MLFKRQLHIGMTMKAGNSFGMQNRGSARLCLPILLNYYDSETASLITGQITDGSNDPRCDYAFCLKVDKNKNYEWRAREVVKDAGYKYDDYRVLYEN